MISIPRVKLADLYFDRLDFEHAVSSIIEIAEKKQHSCALVVTPNVDHVMRCRQSATLAAIYRGAILSLADGMPIVWLSKLVGKPLPGRVTGADLLPALTSAAARANLSVFLFGGPPGSAERAVAKLRAQAPSLKVDYYMPPYGFEKDEAENSLAIAAINRVAPDLLFVGLGSPKQENWISNHATELNVGVALGVGAAIEFAAGDLKRAPKWMQKSGLEWIYRLSMDPRRLVWRYLSNTAFMVVIVQELAFVLRGKLSLRPRNKP